MPSLVVTIDFVEVVLRKARKSTPFRHLVECCMIEWLREEELQWVVDFLQSVSAGVRYGPSIMETSTLYLPKCHTGPLLMHTHF